MISSPDAVLGFFVYRLKAKAVNRYRYDPYMKPPHIRLVMSLEQVLP